MVASADEDDNGIGEDGFDENPFDEGEEDDVFPVEAPSSSASETVIVADRFFVDHDSPMPEFDSPSAKAYRARDQDAPERHLFALVCAPGLPPRMKAMTGLRGAALPNVLPMIDWDIVYWPIFDQWTSVIVYEAPKGGRVADVYGSREQRINEYELPKIVIQPLVAALRQFHKLGFAHRSVRPNNLYYMDAEKTEIMLGDCVTAPAGYDQPLVFETIERSMAIPAGRGEGDFLDDIYALGVTCIFLLAGKNPAQKMKTNRLLGEKILHGSFTTLIGKEKLPLPMIEPLRGFLADDLDERWDFEEIRNWLDGIKQSRTQRTPQLKADIPIEFAGQKHFTARSLGHAFTQDVEAARKFILEGTVEKWLRRNLRSPELADHVADMVESQETTGNIPTGAELGLPLAIAAMLDPWGPVRYKGFAFMQDGLGPAMAFQMVYKGDADLPAQIISRNIPGVWQNVSGGYRRMRTEDERKLAQLRAFLQITDPGYGIERCLYELNPSLPCQSPMIINDYVVSIQDLLPALEEASKYSDTKTKPLDRHISAFIAARFEEDLATHFRAIAQPVESDSIVGVLSLMAYLQWRLKSEPLYGLASWLGGLLGPAINTYHSRSTRQDLEKELPKLVRQGFLPELFDLIENPEKRRIDKDNYAHAVAEFAEAEAEVLDIEQNDGDRHDSALKTGQQSAAMGAFVLAAIIICVMTLTTDW